MVVLSVLHLKSSGVFKPRAERPRATVVGSCESASEGTTVGSAHIHSLVLAATNGGVLPT